MKKLSILVILVMAFTMACKKVDDNAFIPECENITGGTMQSRQDQCKSCCRSNGWDDGAFMEMGPELGCECYKLGSAMYTVPNDYFHEKRACVTESKRFGTNHFAALGFANKWRANTYSEKPAYAMQL